MKWWCKFYYYKTYFIHQLLQLWNSFLANFVLCLSLYTEALKEMYATWTIKSMCNNSVSHELLIVILSLIRYDSDNLLMIQMINDSSYLLTIRICQMKSNEIKTLSWTVHCKDLRVIYIQAGKIIDHRHDVTPLPRKGLVFTSILDNPLIGSICKRPFKAITMVSLGENEYF